MEHDISLPRSQEPSTCPYPEQDRFSASPPPAIPLLLRSILMLFSHLRLGLPSDDFNFTCVNKAGSFIWRRLHIYDYLAEFFYNQKCFR